MLKGSWDYSTEHSQLCQVIETQTLWGETTCRVWLPDQGSVVRVPASRLAPLGDSGIGTAENIAYVAAIAKVADSLAQDMFLAPIESYAPLSSCHTKSWPYPEPSPVTVCIVIRVEGVAHE